MEKEESEVSIKKMIASFIIVIILIISCTGLMEGTVDFGVFAFGEVEECSDSRYNPVNATHHNYIKWFDICRTEYVGGYYKEEYVCKGGFLGIGQTCFETENQYSSYNKQVCWNIKTGEKC